MERKILRKDEALMETAALLIPQKDVRHLVNDNKSSIFSNT